MLQPVNRILNPQAKLRMLEISTDWEAKSQYCLVHLPPQFPYKARTIFITIKHNFKQKRRIRSVSHALFGYN